MIFKEHWHLDFETRSFLDVKKVSSHVYASDETTEVLCLVYKHSTWANSKLWIPEEEECPFILKKAVLNGEAFKAHNAAFEFSIWNFCCRRLYSDFPALKWKQLYCSAAEGAALALPRSLDGVAKAVDSPKQKDEEGKRIMQQLARPRKPTKNNPKVWVDDYEKFEKLFDYCQDDVLTEEACSEILKPLTRYERNVFILDQKINFRGVYCDLDSCHKALKIFELYEKNQLQRLRFITNEYVQTGNQRDRIINYLSTHCGIRLLDLTKDYVEDKVEELEEKEFLEGLTEKEANGLEVLQIRLNLNAAAIKKYHALIRWASDDSRIRNLFLYHGASTGRWAGKGPQPQNLPRGVLKEDETGTVFKTLHEDILNLEPKKFIKKYEKNVLGALGSGLRGMLCGPPGKELIACDFSSIESRVLFWVSGCKLGLEQYNSGTPIYESMAADIYDKALELVNKLERQLGKQAILGLGYGMGWKTFMATCETYRMEVTEELAKKAVRVYRDKYFQVPAFWKAQERAAKMALEHPGKAIKAGMIYWQQKGRILYCKLPSGRLLSYFDPKLVEKKTKWGYQKEIRFMGVDSKTRKWTRLSTYGGKLTENIVQAIARDLLVESMFKLEREGYEIVLHVHDEVVVEVGEGRGCLKEIRGIMSEVPDWGEGMPIDAAGWRGKRFKKD